MRLLPTRLQTRRHLARGVECAWVTLAGAGLACGLLTLSSCTDLTVPGSGANQVIPVTWRQVEAGSDFTCGLLQDGRVFCWGLGYDGQLGHGYSCDGLLDCVDGSGYAMVPVAVVGGYRFTSIAVGWYHACGLTNGGHAYCWGAGYSGQLGNGLGAASPVPVPVPGNHVFTSIAAGWYHVCALATDGKAYCWGAGYAGQIGNGGFADVPVPTEVAGGHTFSSISAGQHTCALTPEGVAYCWGGGNFGQLGNGSFSGSTTPVQVSGNTRFVSISAGDTSTCAVTPGGTLYCWGDGSRGQLGGLAMARSAVPVAVGSAELFTTISSGSEGCGTTTSGQAYCWGDLPFAGTVPGTSGPSLVSGGLSFVRISVGVAHVCAVTPQGGAYCWGDSVFGALGNGSIGEVAQPRAVSGPFDSTASG